MKKPRNFVLALSIALLGLLLAPPGFAQVLGFVQGEIVINEIMQNPAAVFDADGEWFELHNPTGSPIDINGWTIADNDFDTHTIDNGGPLLVPAGGYVVLANNADSATNGGVTVDYQYDGMVFFLSNGADELVLQDTVGAEVDRVEWDNGVTFPDPNGASMALIDPALDNNVGANWCESSTPFGAGDRGTPGAVNDCVEVVPELVINEIMQNPNAVADTDGEWFELYNPTSSDVDIDGWTIRDDGLDSHVINNGGPLLVPAGGFLVLANNGISATNGGVAVDYDYGRSFFLSNASDELVLEETTGVEVDRVAWDDGATFPDPTGAAMALIDPAVDNSLGANWCTASTPYGDGDLGTPGAANDCAPPAAQVVINEIHADPAADISGDANGDGVRDGSEDEFLEIVNISGAELDISGWMLSDAVAVRHTFPAGSVLPADCALVVFGGGTPTGAFGDSLVQVASGGFLGFNNGGDTIVINDGLSDVASYTYGAEGGSDQSLTRDPDITGAEPLVLHTSAAGSGGALFSPGTRVDGASFAGCFPSLEIYEIQATAHLSPFAGRKVETLDNIVTAVTGNGFWMQTPAARDDADSDTSNGIFVFTGGAPGVAIGDQVDVLGTVAEFRPGGLATGNLTITEFDASGLVVTVDSSGNPLPAPTIIGIGGRLPPDVVIDDDATGNVETSGTFDPDTDGIDFYESLEGMRVQINDAIVVGPTNRFGETWVVGDEGNFVSDPPGLTPRGGVIISPTDFNPERIQLDDPLYPGTWPLLHVGARLASPAIGVVHYGFGNFEVYVNELFSTDTSAEVSREVTSLTGQEGSLTVATFNVENLGANDAASDFDARADQIVNHLLSPDIVVLEEMQDNDGETAAGDPDATVTFQTLIAAIASAGGPTYAYQQIDPLDGADGGIPGGNIRVGFLYNPLRVGFTFRPGGDATTPNTVSCTGGIASLDLNPGRVDPNNLAYVDSRKPLAIEFSFAGETVYVVGVHFSSKGGDDPLFGFAQPPVLHTEAPRIAQAQAVNDFVDAILACDPQANIVVAGDVNDFQFSAPVAALQGGVLQNLMDLLPLPEQYSYVFQGNSQVLDQILVSFNVAKTQQPAYDVVHVNSEFHDQVSDHEPSVGLFCIDATGPTVDISLSHTVLFPPNHKYRTVHANVSVGDNTDSSPDLALVSVTSNEPDNGEDDGDTVNDIVIVDDFTFRLRAERSGAGTGRIYTITYLATDDCGNQTLASATVKVPLARGK